MYALELYNQVLFGYEVYGVSAKKGAICNGPTNVEMTGGLDLLFCKHPGTRGLFILVRMKSTSY